MRMSQMFGQTLREIPADAALTSHRLSLRAGLIRQTAAGIYSYLPIGWRVLQNIQRIIRQELDAIGGQELSMPLVQPAELWRASGRYDAPTPGPVLMRLTDRGGHDMVLAMTHEEAVTALARSEIRSYRQLPLLVYQIQLKYRDEARARGGLVRTREFLMKDGYSFHASVDSLEETYQQVYEAYQRIMQRLGLDVLPVQADSGMMGGSASHEFMLLHPDGEDTLVTCDACGYAANAEHATFGLDMPPEGQVPAIERVATPGTSTIASLAELLGIETRETAKAVFYSTDGPELVFAVIRGDLEINESKLGNTLGGIALHPATPEELESAGMVAGYASPVGITPTPEHPVRVVLDESLRHGGYVAGANAVGYHLRNVSYPRDFAADTVADIALAPEGGACPQCGAPLRHSRGIEVGHVFKLGTKYAETMGASYSDQKGQAQPLLMGCYGIGLGRLLACIIEQHHDEHGICWPASVAPYAIHIVSLGEPDSPVGESAVALYERLLAAGHSVLLDDRDERAGSKFADADLIGCPLRLTVSKRTHKADAVELKWRDQPDRQTIPLAQLDALLAMELPHD